MNRRGFLKLLGLGAAAVAAEAVLDTERLLWVPGQRTYFDQHTPDIVGVDWGVGDDFAVLNGPVDWDWFAKESLRVLASNLELAKHVNRQYDDRFVRSFSNLGPAIRVRVPARFA